MEMCEDNYEKYCTIEYKKTAEDEEVEICNEVLERNCDEPGPTVCETVFESQCKTHYHVHEVEEDKPNCNIQMVIFIQFYRDSLSNVVFETKENPFCSNSYFLHPWAGEDLSLKNDVGDQTI